MKLMPTANGNPFNIVTDGNKTLVFSTLGLLVCWFDNNSSVIYMSKTISGLNIFDTEILKHRFDKKDIVATDKLPFIGD